MAIRSRIFISLVYTFACYIIISTQDVAKLPYCNDNIRQSELIFVSTLDGKFSALGPDGDLSWQLNTGPGSLLNSNIHKLELTNNGQWIRIIPSLSGSLYKFNGITIDPIPISADSLLTSSFRYLDDLAIAGGREVRTYGMLLNSGKPLYECTLNGCRNTTNDPVEIDDVIIVERKTHTVHAVEPRTGIERWNFSVGQHNIKIPYLSCIDVNIKTTNINISAVLPEGLIIASKVEELTEIVWQYRFDTPIVAVWRWNGREIVPLNLFSSPTIMTHKTKENTASIYVGMHNKQLYVHESSGMQNILQLKQQSGDKDSVVESQSLTQIPWKPVPAVGLAINSDDADDSTALSVLYASEYVNGNGFYLYTEEKAVCDNNITNTTTSHKINSGIMWYWWKEAFVITLLTIIICNIAYSLLQPKNSQVTPIISGTEYEDISFSSRYISEFDPIACLGRGGFGVVFQAKKKFDECDYAIKRITLPKKPSAKDRMMREVKALAKLDHRNIVRYYNAWLESPPHGWLKEHDQHWLSDTSSLLDNSMSMQGYSENVPSSLAINVEHYNYSELHSDSFKEKQESATDGGSSIVFEGSTVISSPGTIEDSKSNLQKNCRKISESHSLNIYSYHAPVYLYIQMQLCCKESLKDWLNACPARDQNQLLGIFGQIVEAVEYVHFRGLIHRDLKPSNIFFSLEGQIKVGDFGLVTSIKEYDVEDDASNASLKKSYTNAVGTQLYMSPEQLNGQQYDYKVDIYSLGIIFFELLVPFRTEMERISVLMDVRNRKYPKEFTAPISKEFELLDSMLSTDPKQRPTAAGIREQLALDESNKIEDSRFEFKLPSHLSVISSLCK